MGMFDYIRCKYPLPISETQDLQYQTKDTDAQFLDLYELREDGTLWHEEVKREWREDKDAPLGGYFDAVSTECVQQPIAGEIRFYSDYGQKNSRGWGDRWVEYSAYFENGKLIRLNLIEDREV